MERHNESLLSVREAQQRLLDQFQILPVEFVPLASAGGRVLAQAIHSPLDLPPFPNSSMDGFAVRAEDVHTAGEASPVALPVVADIPAGKVSTVHLQTGQAARIMTGAPMPEGANAVVPVEDTDVPDRSPGTVAPLEVKIFHAVQAGENLRPRGMDVRVGEKVLEAGHRLRAQDLGMLAMLGVANVPVHRRPRIGVFSTGDELAAVDEPLQPGMIHDANTYSLLALVQSQGAEAINLGVARDREDEVRSHLEAAAEAGVDLILSSAGVSVGAFDFVRSVVEASGGLDFWRVNMRPGKPLAFGHYREIPFIGLPGNPVSAFVGFEVFVRPAIARLAGQPVLRRTSQQAELAEPLQSDGRESYLRAIVEQQDGRWIARLTGHQGSGNLLSLVQANALLIVPSGVKSLPAGAQVEAWLLNSQSG